MITTLLFICFGAAAPAGGGFPPPPPGINADDSIGYGYAFAARPFYAYDDTELFKYQLKIHILNAFGNPGIQGQFVDPFGYHMSVADSVERLKQIYRGLAEKARGGDPKAQEILRYAQTIEVEDPYEGRANFRWTILDPTFAYVD